jgi:hypothetical protein
MAVLRSGLAAAAVTALLVAALGSEWAYEQTFDADESLWPILRSLTELPTWAPVTALSDGAATAAIAIKLVVLLAAAFGMGAAAGRSQSAGTAFLAGWGGFVLASALAGAVGYVAFDGLVDDAFQVGLGEGSDLPAGVVLFANQGAAFALYTGALVGGAVALTRRRGPRPLAFGAAGATPTPYGGPAPAPPSSAPSYAAGPAQPLAASWASPGAAGQPMAAQPGAPPSPWAPSGGAPAPSATAPPVVSAGSSAPPTAEPSPGTAPSIPVASLPPTPGLAPTAPTAPTQPQRTPRARSPQRPWVSAASVRAPSRASPVTRPRPPDWTPPSPTRPTTSHPTRRTSRTRPTHLPEARNPDRPDSRSRAAGAARAEVEVMGSGPRALSPQRRSTRAL